MEPKRKPFKCPVCKGMGKLKHPVYTTFKFYRRGDPYGIFHCRPCNGEGIVWSRE